MSAPDTNIERQQTRHKPALIGIRAAMVFGALMLVLMIIFTLLRADDPVTLEGSEGTSPVALDPYTPGTNQSN